MNRKLKNTVSLAVVLVVLAALGFGYLYIFQGPKIKAQETKINDLKAQEFDTESLNQQLREKIERARSLDSVLAARKFNIPKDISPLHFYEFMNEAQKLLEPESRVNIEFIETVPEKEFFFHKYVINGICSFIDLYQLIYALEQSKELKKIKNLTLLNFVDPNSDKDPRFLVNFTFTLLVYFSNNDRFTTVDYVEHDLRTHDRYDIFSPLVSTNVPLNTEGLVDVQGARVLAVVPEGVFLADVKGETYLLAEGDKVYLGYLTKINFEDNSAKFILNKGGIVETLVLSIEKEKRNGK